MKVNSMNKRQLDLYIYKCAEHGIPANQALATLCKRRGLQKTAEWMEKNAYFGIATKIIQPLARLAMNNQRIALALGLTGSGLAGKQTYDILSGGTPPPVAPPHSSALPWAGAGLGALGGYTFGDQLLKNIDPQYAKVLAGGIGALGGSVVGSMADQMLS